MEIYLEEFKKENGFITVFDDDAMVTIQMSVESVNKIINVFDDYIMNGQEHKEVIVVTEFGNTIKLDLSLKNYDESFKLTGSILDNNYYHDFELEYCDIETWNKIKVLCLS